jgi:general secretion pathway protein B
MSYILDALKRADTERERGQVPGLHAHAHGDALAAARAGGLPRWALLGAGVFGLAVVAALAWRLGADAHAPLPAPAVGPTEPEPSAARQPTPHATAEDRRPPAVAPVPAAAPPTVQDPVVSAPPPVAVAPARTPEVTKPPAAAAPATPEPAAPIPLLSELPPSVSRQLPKLTVTGSVFSPDASARFIMLNGEVVKEGGQPAPGLVVERIEPKSAVLRFKGERFRLPY